MKTKITIKSRVPVNKKRDKMVDQRCDHCGEEGYALWTDPKNGSISYIWCKKPECKTVVQAKAPAYIADAYREKIRPKHGLRNDVNEIELVIHEPGSDPSVVRGKSAQLCYDAWGYSADRTDLIKVEQLYKIAPKSKYLIFNEDGMFLAKVTKYRDAEQIAGKERVIVWWGGR